MAKKEVNTQQQILAEIRQRNFRPLYLLMGEEPYGIDVITEAILESALTEEERDFNQSVFYGGECDVATVINSARRYPMMAQRQLVVLKEAQQLRNLDELLFYAQHPLTSTILVLNYKNGVLRSKKLVAEFEKNGVVFESKKPYDSQLPGFVAAYLSEKGVAIDSKAQAMLVEAVGADLSRLAGELDKLILTTDRSQGRSEITAVQVEEHIGISKEYNNFELLHALITRNIKQANRIQRYFEKNPRSTPLLLTVSVLFNFYSNLMLLYFCKDRSEQAIMGELRLRSVYQARDYALALRNYNAFKCMEVISLLRLYDCKSKGVNNATASDAALLKELIFKILH